MADDKTLDKVDKIKEIFNKYVVKNFTGSIVMKVHFSQGGITDVHKIEKVKV